MKPRQRILGEANRCCVNLLSGRRFLASEIYALTVVRLGRRRGCDRKASAQASRGHAASKPGRGSLSGRDAITGAWSESNHRARCYSEPRDRSRDPAKPLSSGNAYRCRNWKKCGRHRTRNQANNALPRPTIVNPFQHRWCPFWCPPERLAGQVKRRARQTFVHSGRSSTSSWHR